MTGFNRGDLSILVLNAGSTSLKFGLFDADTCATQSSGSLDWADGNRHQARFTQRWHDGRTVISCLPVLDDQAAAIRAIESVATQEMVKVVGHRIVHGGTAFPSSRLIDESVKVAIGQLANLAPLHNPPALKAIEAVEAVLPGKPQVAVFDTAFFARLPARAYLYPLPFEWQEQWGLRRFGFHGISNDYCAQRVAELLGHPLEDLRLITCHLGGGCSATAVQRGVPVATTMGFTPLEGLMMGTRSGSVDPGLLLHLQRDCQLSVDDLSHALNHQSGLLGVSGLSADLAVIESAMPQGHERARLAFEMFADRVRSAIGGLAVTMGGVEVLVFTDRAGENSPGLRAAVCQGLSCLGLHLDPDRNRACVPDADIAAPNSPCRIWVIHTQEELMIAREAHRILVG